MLPRLPQDLHVHTTWSTTDGAIDPRQTVELVAGVRHALILGVSDHLEAVVDRFDEYARSIRGHGLWLGTEVDGADWAPRAVALPVDYFVYHCRNRAEDYRGAATLLATGKPLIIAHPQMLETDPDRLPTGCLIEINNRYVWQRDGEPLFAACIGRFDFVISSDAHQPHWLSQSVARAVAERLGIPEKILFAEPVAAGR
jgi:histidinol phosphatase-like PHP family hydrolase